MKGSHFRRFSGIHSGKARPLGNTLPPWVTRHNVVTEFFPCDSSDSGEATTLRRTQQERQC